MTYCRRSASMNVVRLNDHEELIQVCTCRSGCESCNSRSETSEIFATTGLGAPTDAQVAAMVGSTAAYHLENGTWD